MTLWKKEHSPLELRLLALLDTQSQQIEAAGRWQREQIELLTRLLTDMKRQGFSPKDDAPTFQHVESPLPATVLDAIEQRAYEGTALWDQLIRYARTELHRDRDPESVATAIIRGSSYDLEDEEAVNG